MTERPEAPPEGALLKRALVAARISQREAARRSGISETRWRQLVSGYQVVSRNKVPVRSPDETLARMARAVGVTAEELEEADRGKAAAVLREAEADADNPAAPGADSAGTGPQSRVDERWHLVQAVLRQARAGLTTSEYDTLAGRITAYVARPTGEEPAEPAP
ncbi:helix-turn-helix domain-containing protein [Actinacidiphila bryophytorum]|jgi:transcriptional regulator with XRE-family HTH domain|uniref:helix-turn-helix domain-containing protein n=1 Tax=Actinacidiphila bryophytorum TaxID=1436133 RepID=UPI002176AE1E|nr:helix-turn-helix transcriptional regulator [Actinacidiphila bryophytorum]UWE07501.1 helix-turn-helix domain-containing protein [Actinacidiphila bryophytorum]